jgi:hypothetical protein
MAEKRATGRSRIRLQLAPAEHQGFVGRSVSRGKRAVGNYAHECMNGAMAYPKAVYEGARRVQEELALQSEEDRRIGLYLLGFYGMAGVISLLLWLLIGGWIGPIPMLVLGYFWFSPKRQMDLRRAFRRWIIGGDELQGRPREIPLPVLRQVARSRLRALGPKLDEWGRLSSEEQLVQAPTVAHEILWLLGEEFQARPETQEPTPPTEAPTEKVRS